MTQSKHTKRALFASVLSMVLCCAMLIGTTFAWFTDSVTSGNNRIVAGNLDVDLIMDKAADGEYVSIANSTGDIFSETGNGANWEPGKTEIVYLGVQNKGSLALKYNILLNVQGELAGALEYAVLDGAQAKDLAEVKNWADLKAIEGAQTGAIQAGTMTAAPNGRLDGIVNGTRDETDYFALAVHMKEEAGNEYMKKAVTIDVTVVATQADAESDSFDNQYDAGLPLTQIKSDEDFNAFIKQGGKAMLTGDINAGTEQGSHFSITKNVEIDGNGNTLTTSGPSKSGFDSRVVDMSDLTESTTLTVKNTTVTGETVSGKPAYLYRGISLYNNDSPVLNIINSVVEAGHYAVNIAGENTNPVISIKDSTVKGYCGFQTFSKNTKATFENSTIIGVNQWSGTSSDFSAVVVNADAGNSELTFNNCRFEVQELGDCAETFLSLRTGCTIHLNDCTFTKNGQTISTQEIIKDIEDATNKYIKHYSRDDVSIFIDNKQVK